MVPYWMSRTALLLGEAQQQQLMNKNVLVVGLGGVGGICAEMIARAGVGSMTIVDGDTVDLSNCNRQVAALHSKEKMLKAQVMGERLLDINPALQLKIIADFLEGEKTIVLIEQGGFDYVVDCIDTLTPKVWLMKTCVDRSIPIVSSLGAGGRMDPLQLQIADTGCGKKVEVSKLIAHHQPESKPVEQRL